MHNFVELNAMNECAISFNVLGVWMPIVLILGSCQQKLKTLYPLRSTPRSKTFSGVHGGTEAIPLVFPIHTAGNKKIDSTM